MSVFERGIIEATGLHVGDVLRREPGFPRALHLRPAIEDERRTEPITGGPGANVTKLSALFSSHTGQPESYGQSGIRVNQYFEKSYGMSRTARQARRISGPSVSEGTYTGRVVDNPANTLEALGRNIRELRVQRGHAEQAEFARLIGVSPQMLNDWEAGRFKDLRLKSLLKLIQGIPCAPDELLKGLYDVESRPPGIDELSRTNTRSVLQEKDPSRTSLSPVERVVAEPSTVRSALTISVDLKKRAQALLDLASELAHSAAPARPRKVHDRRASGDRHPPSLHRRDKKPGRRGGDR
jgi:transcriptional regulator with XRE-family HTH domain